MVTLPVLMQILENINNNIQFDNEINFMNKSTARAIEQHGYGNTRLVDGLFSFAPFSKIITN